MDFDAGVWGQISEVVVIAALVVRQYLSHRKNLKATNSAVQATTVAVIDFQKEAERLRTEMNEKFEDLKVSLDDRMKNFRDGVAGNFIALQNNVSLLEKRIERMDDQFVRKDVHDANLRLIEEKLRPIAEMSRSYLQANGTRKRKAR